MKRLITFTLCLSIAAFVVATYAVVGVHSLYSARLSLASYQATAGGEGVRVVKEQGRVR